MRNKFNQLLVLMLKYQFMKIFLKSQLMLYKQLEMNLNQTKYNKLILKQINKLDLFYIFQHFQLIQRGQQLPPDEKPSNMLLLFSYLTSTRMNKTIERNLLMIESSKISLNSKEDESKVKTTKPQDIVRIYDIILQVKCFFLIFF